jgi:hypothetical protein
MSVYTGDEDVYRRQDLHLHVLEYYPEFWLLAFFYLFSESKECNTNSKWAFTIEMTIAFFQA